MDAGVDGLIVVDLPPEADEELCLPAMKAGSTSSAWRRPTTDDKRLPRVLKNTSGFVYYVSITGITGAAAPDPGKVAAAVERIKRHTRLPVAVGFGVKNAEQAAIIGAIRRRRRRRLGVGRRHCRDARRKPAGNEKDRRRRRNAGRRTGERRTLGAQETSRRVRLRPRVGKSAGRIER